MAVDVVHHGLGVEPPLNLAQAVRDEGDKPRRVLGGVLVSEIDAYEMHGLGV